MRSPTIVLTIVLTGGCLAPVAQAQDDEIAIGVARIDITPEYPVRLHGYLARTTESVGVAQRISAKALAIGSDEQKPALLVSVDNLGVGDSIVEEVARRLKRKAGIERARFVVASSHTHSAPCLTNVAPHIFGKKIDAREQATIDRYTRALTDRLERVGLDALKARRPGRLAWAQGRVGFAANRRTKGGPVDHSLPVLRVTDPDGALRALVVNYACHCTTLDPKENTISGDWAGYAQEDLERDHPGVVALTVIGCGADSNPSPRQVPGSAQAHGRSIAEEVNRLLRGAWVPLPGPPETAFRRITLPFDALPTREQLEQLVKKGGPPGYNASVMLARLDRGEPLQRELDYPIEVWRFGDRLAMVFLAGEVVVDYALRLKQEFDASLIWITAYANDLPCYIPSERILREGGYEGGGAMVYYARPTRLAPGVEERIVRAVHDLIPHTFRAVPRAETEMPRPKSPEEALRTFRIKPGLRIELVAAEPLVESPVAIDFGADGKLWVCEMRDYPTGIDGHWKPGGVIKVLEDRDGDGRYDTATKFLDGIPFPTGVMAWRNGALVCAAPEVLYAEDTSGDGRADVRRVLFRGFATENYQARVNGLSYALDNWVYGANGLIGGMIRGEATGRAINIGGRDFRIKPDTGVMEPATGLTQQGRVHDDWGHQFGGNNSILIQHYPLPDHYARRNTRVPSPGPSVYIPRGPDTTRVYPASRTLERYNHPESANRVTSACSPAIFRDTLLGAEYAGNAFVCEPVHNLVHREILTPDGVAFAGHRAKDEATSEFLASTDNWFRPVQVRTGPDGALWVVDMYRFVIEHPRWISAERLAQLDVRAGADKGRIYRIVPEAEKPRPVPNLDRLSTPVLAQTIDSPSGTLRDNVQRLLVHRGDPAAVPVLRRLARAASRAEARAQALGALEGLSALDPDLIRAALSDVHPGVRVQAIRLSEAWLGRDEPLATVVLRHVDDPELTVRYQLALTLGEWEDPRAGRALGRLALKDWNDLWVRGAILSSASRQPATILAALDTPRTPPAVLDVFLDPLIATMASARESRAVNDALAIVTRRDRESSIASWRVRSLARLLDAVPNSGLARKPELGAAFVAARALARDLNATISDRVAAIQLLGRNPANAEADRALLQELLDPAQPVEVQAAVLRALIRIGDPETDSVAVVAWPRLAPALRAVALDALLERPRGAAVLLDAIEHHAIAPTEIDASHRERLVRYEEPDVARRASKAFLVNGRRARDEVLKAYLPTAVKPGDPERGKAVFAKRCAGCHKFAGMGHEVGPDLAALTDTTPEALLTAILEPSRDVDARYASYTAALKDGRVVTGMVASETGNAITLKRQEGQTDVILRADLQELKTTGLSLMPEGLENDVKPSELADLIAFVATGGARPKTLEGNHPEIVNQASDGTIQLSAAAAEVYGPSLTFEKTFGNLGAWHSPDDRAVWRFNVTTTGVYTLTMEWACADESAGNTVLVRVDGQTIPVVVGGTGAGTWSRYQSIFLSEVRLSAGTHRIEFRPEGEIRGALLDLRAVMFRPRAAMRRGDSS